MTCALGVGAACLLTVSLVQIAAAQVLNFKHIVVIVQENRTPDNLFYNLCAPPFGSASSCSTSPASSQYNIQTANWLNKNSRSGITQPEPIPLAIDYDLLHTHPAFVAMCDADTNGACKMDGASGVGCTGSGCSSVSDPQFKFVDNSTGILNPYLELATQYGWANYMFQTNQGNSFPAHLYLFSGTSAPTASDDAAGIFVANGAGSGCISPANKKVELIGPTGLLPRIYPCFEHQTLPDLLPPTATWRYYATPGVAIWNAPLAIEHMCESSGPGGQCTGAEWSNNVDLAPPDVLTDIASCNLRSLSWVIPLGGYSDHAGSKDNDGGPSWVASIVNAIGNSTACDGNTGYWKDTAILITWDDWGGWYDHVRPPILLDAPQGDNERSFRVPLIVVSAYTKRHYISNLSLDFGSMLRFIEHNFGIRFGALNFADARTTDGLSGFFSLSTPRPYTVIAAQKTADFFLNDKRPPTPPDDD